MRPKRKHTKSGDKLSPQEKKTKSVVVIKDSANMSGAKPKSGVITTKDCDNKSVVKSSAEPEIVDPQKLNLLDISKKIDDISKKTDGISALNQSLQDIKNEISTFKKWVEDTKVELNSYKEKTNELEKKVLEAGKTQDLIGLLEKELKASERENLLLKEKLLMQECYSRKTNLIFEEIQEQKDQKPLEAFKNFLKDKLSFSDNEYQELVISDCHRMGRKKENNRPRPLLVRFVKLSDRNKVWFKKSGLKKSSYFVKEDFPDEIVNRRKMMHPLFTEAKKKDKFAKLINDTVTYYGQNYTYARANELAQALSIYNKGLRRGNGVLAFHGRSAIYSNFYPCKVKEGNTTFNCSEQMFQHEKCLYFGDPQSARTVMLKSDPVDMKKIGERVGANDPEREKQWNLHQSRNIMKTAVFLKFSQNPAVMEEMKSTTEIFAEANGHDKFWGTGLFIKDDRILDSGTWNGSNWLGAILTELRDKFVVK